MTSFTYGNSYLWQVLLMGIVTYGKFYLWELLLMGKVFRASLITPSEIMANVFMEIILL